MEMNELKNYLADLLKLIGFDSFEIEVQENPNEKFVKFLVQLEASDDSSGLLIGKGGENLWAFEIILRNILQKIKNDPTWRVSLDVNNYRTIYEEKLREFARKAAYQVALTKKPLELPPMNPKDRRIIHLEIALRSDVTTESIGEGKDRHIIIKPQE
ncbi:MAG: spoIIIJ-associated protein [Patescibacteria group bacterium]|nr:spoIIIJ-associated protein [Patescibacteria group bacterium]